MTVELDVFSGRPNPTWELDKPGRENLWRLQSRLNVSSRAYWEPPALGYRGFLYSDADGGVRAYRGFVLTTRVVLDDPSFTIERYLLSHIPTEFETVRKRIASEIGR